MIVTINGRDYLADPAALLAQYDAITPLAKPRFMLACDECRALCTVGLDCECCRNWGQTFNGSKRIRQMHPHTSLPIELVLLALRRAVEPQEPPGAAFGRGMNGSAKAARTWTDEETAQVDATIRTLAENLDYFSADDVWLVLGPEFRVTKGMGIRLQLARRAGIIRQSGDEIRSKRPGEHGHAQRLDVWEGVR